MKLTNPSLVLEFVKSSVIPITTVTNAEIVRESIEIDSQLMNDLKSTSDKAKITITKKSIAVSRIMSFDGDIKATLKDGDTVLFTGFLSNKYKWSVTNHGEQVLSLTIEDNTRLLETIFSDRDQLVKKEFYIPARSGHPVASGLLVDIANVCGLSLTASVPEIATEVIKNIPSDTECVDIMDKVCFELGYCYKFDNTGKLYLWKIAKGDEAVTATLDKSNLYAVQENGVIVNKSLRQYNRAIVKYSEINSRSNTLIYQDISGQDDTHPYCYVEVAPGTAYPSGLTIAGHTDDQLKAICDATDLDEGMTIIGIGDEVTTDFTCTDASIKADIRKYSATQLSVLIKNTRNVPVFILKLRASASITYDEGETKIYAGSVSDTKFYEAELDYVHDNTKAAELGNLIYQFYKYSNLSYQFYSKEKLEIGDIIKLKEDVHSGIEAKLMVNARVDLSSSDIYQYVAYSFTPFNLSEPTSGSSAKGAPAVIPAKRVIIEYALSDNPYSLYSTFGLNEDSFGCGIETLFGLMNISDWQPSVPYPIPEGKYVWMRTSSDSGKTWAYSRLTGDKGEKGRDGDERQFILNVARHTFIQNRRLDGVQTIAVTCEVIGFPTGYYTVISTSNATYSSGNLIIPYDNSFSTVTVTAELFDAEGTLVETRTETLTPQDETELPQFLGCLSALPTTTKSGQKIIDGDYFCVKSTFSTYEKGDCYRLHQNSWVKLTVANSEVSEMLSCLNGFKQEGVNLQEISSHDAISWFNEIVADKMVADTIKGNNAFFENIEIAKSSTLKGKIDGDVLRTVTPSTSTSSYISDGQNNSGTFKYEDVASYLNGVSKTSGYWYTPSSSSRIEGYTPSQMVYYDPTFPVGGYFSITSGSCTNAGAVVSLNNTFPRYYRIKVDREVKWEIYQNGSLINSGWISYTDSYYWIPIIPVGGTLKLYANIMNTATYDVRSYNVDNFDKGTNIIANGSVYNIGTNQSGNLSHIIYLKGTGSNLKLEVNGGSTWVQCDSSAWTSGITKYTNFSGKTGGTAASVGSGNIYSMNNAWAKYTNGTTKYFTNATSASWGTDFIRFYASGTDIGGLSAADSLTSWYISFSVSSTTAGLEAKGMDPYDSGSYSLGKTNKRWNYGYFNNLVTGSLNTDSFSAASLSATNIYGILGSSGNRKNAYVDNLDCNSITGVSFKAFDPSKNMYCQSGNGGTVKPYSASLTSLSVGEMGVAVFKNRYALQLSISGSGTYGIAAIGIAGNQTEDYGVSYYASSGWSGTAITLGSNSSYSYIGFIVFYWRKS